VKFLIATGLRREAKLMGGPGATVIAGGGDAPRLERELEDASADAELILSSGLAGALDPKLAVGDVVLDGPATLVAQLRTVLPAAHVGRVLGSNVPIGSIAAKAEARRSGAVAVDMESHVARRVAARHGLPCVVARIISDGADHALPPAALAGMKRDGGIAVGAVLASLAVHPEQLLDLIRTARDAQTAFGALGRLHHVLRSSWIGRLDLRQFPLDV
jgi:adenosylhomocysteine nucleosidase